MKILKKSMNRFLLYLLRLLNTPKDKIQSVNKQDIDLLTRNFPVFVAKNEMTCEEIALSTMRSVGEQRVINYMLARIQGRVGQGLAYD